MEKSVLRDAGFTKSLIEVSPKISGFTEATEIRTCACTGGEADVTSQLSEKDAAAKCWPSWQLRHLLVVVVKTTGRAEITQLSGFVGSAAPRRICYFS